MKHSKSQFVHVQEPGFILLFSVVVSAVIFFIGAGIFSLSFKEFLVSTIAQESQKSIFAADSGIECALLADKNGILPTDPSASLVAGSCFGQPFTPVRSLGSIKFSLALDNATCTTVTVTDGTSIRTFTAQGYNKCSGSEPIRGYAGLTERVYRVQLPK